MYQAINKIHGRFTDWNLDRAGPASFPDQAFSVCIYKVHIVLLPLPLSLYFLHLFYSAVYRGATFVFFFFSINPLEHGR